MNWYFIALKNTFNFKGRARRKEYIYFLIFDLIVLVSMFLIEGSILETNNHEFFPIFTIIYFIITFITRVSLNVRRLHDYGDSGILLITAPIILGIIGCFLPILSYILGALFALSFFIFDSEAGSNKYGECPKGYIKKEKEEKKDKDVSAPSENNYSINLEIDKQNHPAELKILDNVESLFCVKCGKEVSSEFEFCPRCGGKIVQSE